MASTCSTSRCLFLGWKALLVLLLVFGLVSMGEIQAAGDTTQRATTAAATIPLSLPIRARVPLLAQDGPTEPGDLRTPSGLRLSITDARRVDIEERGFVLEISALLTNGGSQPVYVLIGVAPERTDLYAQVGTQRQVCGHHFLFFHWDCFTYCNLASDPSTLSPMDCPDPGLRIFHDTAGGATQEPDAAPAELVVAVVGTRDVIRVAEALNLDPGTIRLGAPPLSPGETWPVILRLPVSALPNGFRLTAAVGLADDHDAVTTPTCELPLHAAHTDCLGGTVQPHDPGTEEPSELPANCAGFIYAGHGLWWTHCWVDGHWVLTQL